MVSDERMWRLVQISLQALAVVAGALAIYAGAFVYKKRRGRIRNRLEDWWVELKHQPEFILSPHGAFMRAVARLTMRGFDRLFFPSWLGSFHRFVVTATLSLGSCWLTYFTLVMDWNDPHILLRTTKDPDIIILTVGLLLFTPFIIVVSTYAIPDYLSDFISVVRHRTTKPSSRGGLLHVFYLSVGVIVFVVALLSYTAWFGFLAYLALGATGRFEVGFSSRGIIFILLVFATNFCFLATMSRVLQWCSRSLSFVAIALAVLSICLVASLLFLGPLWFVSDGWTLRAPASRPVAPTNLTSSIARYIAYSNAVDAVVAYAFFAVALLMLVHRLVWSVIKRPIKALERAGIAPRPKVFYGVGIALLALGTGKAPALISDLPELIENIQKLVGK